MPCSEKTYRRLLMLQNVLVTSIPHIAGLNPKGFRTLKQRHKELINPSRSIIDGELVFKFTGNFSFYSITVVAIGKFTSAVL